MIGQAVAFAFAVFGLLVAIGYGVVALLAPEDDGLLPLVPVVGWAVLALALQWLGFALTAPVVLLVALAGFGALSVAMVWRRGARLRRQLTAQRGAVALLLGGGLALYLAHLTFVFAAGVFAFDGIGTDALWLYAHTAEYLTTHPMPLNAPLTTFVQGPENHARQALDIHRALYPAITQTDAALSGVLGWPPHALIQPLDALCIALALPGVWVLSTRGLRLSSGGGCAACALYAAHPLVFWTMGLDFAQQLRGELLLPAALACALVALREGNVRIGVLAGVLAAPLVGMYFPAFAVLALATGAALVVGLIAAGRAGRAGWAGRLGEVGRAATALVGAGIAAALPALYVLFAVSGPETWLRNLRSTHAGAGIDRFFPVRYALGLAPLSDPLKYGPLSPLAAPGNWWLGSVALVCLAALLLLGAVTLLVRGDSAAVAAFGAASGYLLYLRVGAQYPYGFMRTACYVAPFACTLAAAGATDFPALFAGARTAIFGRLYSVLAARRSSLRVACAAMFAAVLLVQGASAVQMERAFVAVGPRYFAPSYLSLQALPSLVPTGASVFMPNEGDVNTLRKQMAAAYFLPDRRVTVGRHPYIPRTPLTEERVLASGLAPYNYALLPAALAPMLHGDFAPRWQDDATGLRLYERIGPRTFYAHRPPSALAGNMARTAVRQLRAADVPLDADPTDALFALARVYHARADLWGRYGGVDGLDLAALSRWAATEGATTDRDREQLAMYAPDFAALATALAARPVPLRVALLPE